MRVMEALLEAWGVNDLNHRLNSLVVDMVSSGDSELQEAEDEDIVHGPKIGKIIVRAVNDRPLDILMRILDNGTSGSINKSLNILVSIAPDQERAERLVVILKKHLKDKKGTVNKSGLNEAVGCLLDLTKKVDLDDPDLDEKLPGLKLPRIDVERAGDVIYRAATTGNLDLIINLPIK